MSDTFIYTIPFEAKAVLRVEKSQIVDAVSMRVGRHLTAEEGNKVWADIKHGDDWKTIFPKNLEVFVLPRLTGRSSAAGWSSATD